MKLAEIKLLERMTSPHVLSRDDITVILNAIKKEFGLSYDTNENIGLCMLSQVIFTIAAVADIDEKKLGDFVSKISHNLYFVFIKPVDKFSKIIKSLTVCVDDKFYQIKLNAHAINDANELKNMLKNGQPVICAVPIDGLLNQMIDDFSTPDEALLSGWSASSFFEDDPEAVKDLKNGFLSKRIYDALKDEYDAYSKVYHASLCIGFESGDKAFLFREPRPKYAKNGYYKVAQELFTPENIGPRKKIFHGMFYVEVIEMKEVEGT